MSVKTNIALVGLGYWGLNLCRNLKHLDVLAAAFDLDEEKLKKFFNDKTYEGVFFDVDWEKCLGRKEIKGVVIATPPNTHYVIAKKALQKGRHVLVEKPMTLDVTEAEELVELAEKKGKILMVGHTFLYSPEIIKLKEIVNHADFGHIFYIYSKRLNLGKLQWPANVIEDLAPHDISIFNYILDKKCRKVQAFGKSYILDELDIEEVAFINMSYGDRCSAHMHLSWLDPLKVRDVVVVGSKQMAVCDSNLKKIEVYDKCVGMCAVEDLSNLNYAQHLLSYKYGNITIPYIESYEPLEEECREFVRCIENNCVPKTDGVLGLEVVKILCAMQKSLESNGGWVEV
jgi:predicted dehydrogenase